MQFWNHPCMEEILHLVLLQCNLEPSLQCNSIFLLSLKQQMEEEKALKQLRRTLVPHARPAPNFGHPFLPQKYAKRGSHFQFYLFTSSVFASVLTKWYRKKSQVYKASHKTKVSKPECAENKRKEKKDDDGLPCGNNSFQFCNSDEMIYYPIVVRLVEMQWKGDLEWGGSLPLWSQMTHI